MQPYCVLSVFFFFLLARLVSFVRFAFPTVVDGFVRVYVFACGGAATRYLQQSARYSSVPTTRITLSRAP